MSLRSSDGDAMLAALRVSVFPLNDCGFAAAVSTAAAERALDAPIFKFVQIATGADVGLVVAVLSSCRLFGWPVHEREITPTARHFAVPGCVSRCTQHRSFV